MDINDYKQSYDINSGFENAAPGQIPSGWTLGGITNPYKNMPPGPAGDILNGKPPSVSVDTSTKAGGRQSLKVVNPNWQELSPFSIVGGEIPVTPGEIYHMSSKVKYKNAEWTNVSVFGLETASGTWVRLASCPPVQSGTSGWKKTDCSFYLPAGISKIKPVLGAGWAKAGNIPATSWFDDVELSRINDRFYSDLDGGGPLPELSFKQLGAEKYQVQVKGARGPYVLVFSEAYDPLWVVHVQSGRDVDPVMTYSTINGFPIDKKGDFKMTLEYVPQRWFTEGLILSLLTLVLCLSYLVFIGISRRSYLNGRPEPTIVQKGNRD